MAEFDTISEGYAGLVRTKGDDVLIHTAHCVEWKLTHDTCKGCKSELGCAKAVAMLGVSMTPLMYKPKDYSDFERMQVGIQGKLDSILKAKTPEAVTSIAW